MTPEKMAALSAVPDRDPILPDGTAESAPASGEPDFGPPDFSVLSPPPLPAPERPEHGLSAPRNERNDPARRVARRRPAGPVRGQIAANDDAPSIGGLIFALEQKPDARVFRWAAIASIAWVVAGLGLSAIAIAPEIGSGVGFFGIVFRSASYLTMTAMVVPVAVIWFLALLAWRTEELRLRSSTMTEVAVRLAEPDRMAEQSIASLGQAVRRQVSFMNDAVSRALGRAGELEALVHSEVAALERSYEDNERKIRGLIQELSGERHALINTSERVSDTLKHLGNDIPALIDKLSTQQVKLATIITGAHENLNSLESSITQSAITLENSVNKSSDRLESTLGGHTQQLQVVLEGYTTALAGALTQRTGQLESTLQSHMEKLDASIGSRTDTLQTVFEEYARALDSTLANRTQALDIQLVERTRSLDAAFAERLRLFDEQIAKSTGAIDTAVNERALALTTALEDHAKTFRETIGRQALELDENLMHGINSVRRTSENITRQSLKAIEGLAGQSELLKNVSENLLGQINSVTNRFESQGQQIMKAANALESANYKIDTTLQNRHADLSGTLDKLSGKADEFGRFVQGYSSSIEGRVSDAEQRARYEMERLKSMTSAEGERALADLRSRFAATTNEVQSEITSMSSKVQENSDQLRVRAQRAAAEIAEEQQRLRSQIEQLPMTTRESADAMRSALQDQLAALDQLSQITARGAVQRDVKAPVGGVLAPPVMPPPPSAGAGSSRALSSLSSSLASEMANRRPGQPAPMSEAQSRWSLGDLLARASLADDHHAGGSPSASGGLDIEGISRALDPSTAAAIWAKVRSGQRNVMIRSIYSNEGRAVFDEVSRRCKVDPELAVMVGRYLADFDGMLRETEARDPTGRSSQAQLVSESGRVYLFLSHAIGRLG